MKHATIILLLSGGLWANDLKTPRSHPQSGLTITGNRAGITVNGQRLSTIYSDTHPVNMHKHNQQMAEAGVQVFMIKLRGDFDQHYFTSYFWRDEDVYGDESDRKEAAWVRDELDLNSQAQAILKINPSAFFMVRWMLDVPLRWGKKNPNHMQFNGTRRLDRASYASKKAIAGRVEMVRRLIKSCEAQSWGKRIIGYIPFGQDEGTHELSLFHGMFDQAPVMQSAYKDFLLMKYEKDAALQKAWHDPGVSLKAVKVPTDAEWQADRKTWLHWPDPKALRRYQDYFLLLRKLQYETRRAELAVIRETAKRPLLTATDSYKEPMLGWLHNDAFFGSNRGMDWRNVLLSSGCFDAGEALDMPELDCLITPADYTARSNGMGWDSEGIADSLVLRGKTILIEDDARSWVKGGRKTQGAWRNEAECRAGLMRNLCLAASRAHFPYWMNVGGGFFDDPVVLKVIKEQIPVREKLLSRTFERTEHAIAMIIDDTSPLDEDFTSGFQNLAVLRQRNDHLSNTGIPWRIFLFSDLERENFPVYRTYILPNCFRLTPRKLSLIRKKLMRHGSVVILGPGTGISDGEKTGPEMLSKLMSMPFGIDKVESARRVLVYGGSHKALADMRGPVTFGDSYAYGPILYPEGDVTRGGAVELGKESTWWQGNRSGLVIKGFGKGPLGNGVKGARGTGDCALVFTMATPLPSALLRSLAIYGGCNPWSDLGDVVAANGNMLAVHSIRPGKRTIRLPKPYLVTDAVTGEVIVKKGKTCDLILKSPDTRVFLLDQPASLP